jgi:hypothetical protein
MGIEMMEGIVVVCGGADDDIVCYSTKKNRRLLDGRGGVALYIPCEIMLWKILRCLRHTQEASLYRC